VGSSSRREDASEAMDWLQDGKRASTTPSPVNLDPRERYRSQDRQACDDELSGKTLHYLGLFSERGIPSCKGSSRTGPDGEFGRA